MLILNLEDYCIPCSHNLFGQTTKELLKTLNPKNLGSRRNFEGPDSSFL